MKKYIALFLFAFILIGLNETRGQVLSEKEKKEIVEDLTTIDPNISRYFPRWKVCEDDIKLQIHQAFLLLGYEKSELNIQQIEVLAAPRTYEGDPYDLLLITCGEASMNAVQIERNLGRLVDFLSGYLYYSPPYRGQRKDWASRDYCYEDIPPDIPVTDAEITAIQNYLQPTNVTHAFTLSLFEQSLKIGTSGFWLRSSMGSDEVGYPFWTSGEARVVLQRPLYANLDGETSRMFPYLINAYLGGGYRVSSGLDNSSSILSWVAERKLNTGPGGKLIGGFDFHVPLHPYAGIHFNASIPFQSLKTESIEEGDYSYYLADELRVTTDPIFFPQDAIYDNKIIPVLRSTGQFSFFYYWLPNKKNPENFFRFDLGICYSEVAEMGGYFQFTNEQLTAGKFMISQELFDGLKIYSPNELGDWVYMKAQYRNQASFPFGLSVQYSNQIFLGRVFIPILGNWLYIDAKYATPLRGSHPFENEDFYMISPLLRITI